MRTVNGFNVETDNISKSHHLQVVAVIVTFKQTDGKNQSHSFKKLSMSTAITRARALTNDSSVTTIQIWSPYARKTVLNLEKPV